MRKISSDYTFFHKKIFPILWFGFLAFFIFVAFVFPKGQKVGPPLPFILIPLIMGLFGFTIMKYLVFDLADEVYDGGDFLLVKMGDKEDRVALTNIKNISYSMTRPPRVTLSLRTKSLFGSEIVFSPPVPFSLNPFQKNPTVEELINRVDESRSR